MADNKIFKTSYLAGIKHLEDDYKIIFICRYLPPSVNLEILDAVHIPELAPMTPTLRSYKSGAIGICRLKDIYRVYLNDNKDRIINLVNSKILDNKICFVCLEKDIETCHRKELAEFLIANDYIYEGEL